MNEEQAEYWGGPNADKWVQHQARLDRTFDALTESLLERAALGPGMGVLDVGCGTGDTTLRAAAVVGEAGEVLGLDLSAPMLAHAERRRARAGLSNVRFVRGDAQTEALEPRFDRLVSRFGVMFFEDPVAAFRNLHGALRPGGTLCMACWAPLADNPWMGLGREAAERLLGPVEPGPPGGPDPFAFADADHVREILTEAGFEDVEAERCERPLWAGADAQDAADFMTRMGPAAYVLRVREAGEAERLRLVEAVRDTLPSAWRDASGEVRAPGAFWIYRAAAAKAP